ncbi:MAG: hypothetical protein DI539_06445 [Flavobacterium psychrophilum]|nr:MAG: hypothetical protein DI539_06445 [Flavobacterium psychrophilum]
MSENTFFINNYRHLTRFDARVEVLFEALLQSNMRDTDIIVKPNGLFYRKFSKDLMSITQDVNDSDVLNIAVSRDGFYDILPESITHNYRGRDLREDPVQDFKSRKKEEKEARHFFNPLENEFFRFRHSIEKFESEFFASLNTSGVADIIKSILGIEKELPDFLIVKLFYALMKQKSNPKSKMRDLCDILKDIMGEEVSFTSSHIEPEHTFDIEEKQEDMIMGVNTTLTSHEKIFLKKYHFNVGTLKNPDNVPLYFGGQVLEHFLTTFFDMFLPFHSQFSFQLHLNPEDELFAMDDTTVYKSRLGISTVL